LPSISLHGIIEYYETGGKIMGPYYRGTSHGMGAFIEMFYEYPILMLLLLIAVAAAGFFIWRRKKSAK
jgi:hypothetical protein